MSSTDSYTESIVSTVVPENTICVDCGNECKCSDCKCNDINEGCTWGKNGCECCQNKEDEEEEIEKTESVGSTESDVDDTILRGKWIYDGCNSIDDMIQRLHEEITLLEDLKREGWYLVDEVENDYACFRVAEIGD